MIIATIMNQFGAEETREFETEFEAREQCRRESAVLIGINPKEVLL